MLTTTTVWLLFALHSYGGATTIATFPTEEACREAIVAINLAATKRQPDIRCAEIKRTYTR